MKRVKLSDMSTEGLVQSFTDLAVQQDAALLYRAQGEVNKLYFKLDAIKKELKPRPGDQRVALLPLYDHKTMQVRVKAAKATLAIAPEVARARLAAMKGASAAAVSARGVRRHQQNAQVSSASREPG